MHVQPVEPRDAEIEIDSPTYRVYFWERQATQEDETRGFKSFEHEITDARDVHEVLRWAEANAGGRTVTAYVVAGETLVRLSGHDPTAAS